MKTVVCVRQVDVIGDEIEFTDDGTAVDPDYVDHALNEWDAYATEEALRLRESAGGEVVAVTVGGSGAEDVLRVCLAMGVDRASRVEVEGPGPGDPLAVAHFLAEAVRSESPDLVLCGAQSADGGHGATGVALAQLLDVARVAVVRSVELAADGTALVERELEGGVLDVVEVDLPAVLTIQTGINEPRYATLRAIRDAEAKEIALVPAAGAGPAAPPRRLSRPSRQEGAEMLGSNPAEVARRIRAIVAEKLA